MHWVVPIWSAITAVSLTLAGISALVWFFDRKRRSTLLFAIVAFGVAIWAPMELGMMYAKTPAAYGEWVRWCHLPSFLVLTSTLLFVRSYLGTGRVWLACTFIAIRGVVLVCNFLVTPNFHWHEITNLQQITFLGDEVAVIGHAVVRNWQWLATSSLVLYTGFVVDASVALWRKGGPDERRRVVVLGCGM